MNMPTLGRLSASALLLGIGLVTQADAQTLETETTRLPKAGWWEIGNAFEFQTSAEGTETAVPLGIELGLTDRLELLVEPVAYTAIRPHAGRHATGVGDIEVTLTYRFLEETASIPALAVAGEVKAPTARDSLIGTGHADYAGYLIASKRFGRLDVHANVAYTIVGKPAGVQLRNIASFALAGVYRAGPRVEVFGEVLGNTSATSGPEMASGGSPVPEAAGGEIVATAGAGRHIGSALLVYLGVSYDNNNAVQLRPGFTLRFR
jgi:hypothetical protein